MAEDPDTTEVFQRACEHVGFPHKFAHDLFVERFFQDRLSEEFSPEEFALVAGNSHLEAEMMDFFKDDDESPGASRHWLFTSVLRNFRRTLSSAAGTGAGAAGFRSLSHGTITPKVESPALPRRYKTKEDLRPRSDHK
jgi:hypothetical protein